MSISKIREDARTALNGKWGKGASIVLAYLVMCFIVGFIIGLFGGDETLVGSILDMIFSIIQVPLSFGMTYAFIKLKRDEEVRAFDFFSIGFSNFGRAWKIGLREVLKVILPIILIIISVVIIYSSIGFAIISGFTDISTLEVSWGILLVGLILFLVSDIWLAVRSLLYSLTALVAYDNPNMSSLEVVNESERLMKGNRVKLVLLTLSFIGWAILALFTLGIGYLWLIPYAEVAEICFYEHLVGKKHDTNDEDDGNAIKEM